MTRDEGPLRKDAVAEQFYRCGALAAGFTRLQCPDCGREKLLAFSCKTRRFFCPGCHQRRDIKPAIGPMEFDRTCRPTFRKSPTAELGKNARWYLHSHGICGYFGPMMIMQEGGFDVPTGVGEHRKGKWGVLSVLNTNGFDFTLCDQGRSGTLSAAGDIVGG